MSNPKKKKKVAVRRESLNLTLTDDIIEALCDIVGAGNFRTIAFQQLGVPATTYQSWLSRGKIELKEHAAGNRPKDRLTAKADLVLALERAEAECHQELLRDVLSAEDPRVKMEFLSRRFKKLYTKTLTGRALDDESGQDVTRSGVEILTEKLARFLEDD